MRVSVSQIETFQSCPTKWWRDKVLKEGPSGTQNTFGTVFHACAERVVKGKDPFPEGWESAIDRFSGKVTGTLSNNDQALIRFLIKAGTLAGLFATGCDASVEHEFSVDLCEGVTLWGFIDLVEPGIITDHKTTSAMKWAETEETLSDNLQLLAYAKVTQQLDQDVKLRHNVFCKTPPSVKRVEVTVKGERIDQEWAKMQAIGLQMKALKEVSDPALVPKNEHECNNWGGCPFKAKCFPGEDY